MIREAVPIAIPIALIIEIIFMILCDFFAKRYLLAMKRGSDNVMTLEGYQFFLHNLKSRLYRIPVLELFGVV